MGKRSRRNKGQEAPADGVAAAEPTVDADLPVVPPADAGKAVKAVEAALEGREPGAPDAPSDAGGPKRSPLSDPRLREVIAYAEEADMIYHLYRWILLKGTVPVARDWLPREEMPHPDAVSEVFGGWQKFLDHAQIAESPMLARLKTLEEQAKAFDTRQKQLDREEQRAADQKRQLDVARRRREDAERERDEASARAGRAERALQDAEGRAAAAEERLAERRAAAEEVAAASTGREEVSEEWLAVHEAVTAELESVRQHRDDLQRRIDELEAAAARDHQAIAELSSALGDRSADAAEAETATEEDPKSVLEAVRLAAASCPHLTFTESAFESAADSPYRRPPEILDALRKLDELAVRYGEGQMGTSLGAAAIEAGLTWKAGVSELARTRWAKHYIVTHDGHNLDLGPHLALGSGSGAGFVARIYLHVADGNGDVPRGIYVGHVGRHLPDTTT